MPYNAKQKRLFGMCRHNPGKAYAKCPSKKFLAQYASEAHAKKRKRHDTRYN